MLSEIVLNVQRFAFLPMARRDNTGEYRCSCMPWPQATRERSAGLAGTSSVHDHLPSGQLELKVPRPANDIPAVPQLQVQPIHSNAMGVRKQDPMVQGDASRRAVEPQSPATLAPRVINARGNQGFAFIDFSITIASSGAYAAGIVHNGHRQGRAHPAQTG